MRHRSPRTLDLAPLSLALLALASTGCADRSTLGPEPGDPTALARADALGTPDRRIPFRGEGRFAPAPEPGFVNCFLPDGTPANPFPAAFEADQWFTQLGRTAGEIAVASCRIDPATGRMVLSGEVIHTGEGGERLYADYELVVLANGRILLESRVTGGTGRLAGAGGAVRGRGVLDPATGVGDYRLAGFLVLPGS